MDPLNSLTLTLFLFPPYLPEARENTQLMTPAEGLRFHSGPSGGSSMKDTGLC